MKAKKRPIPSKPASPRPSVSPPIPAPRPPRKSKIFLAATVVLLVAWLTFLTYLALHSHKR